MCTMFVQQRNAEIVFYKNGRGWRIVLFLFLFIFNGATYVFFGAV
jgi:hypothetical protein